MPIVSVNPTKDPPRTSIRTKERDDDIERKITENRERHPVGAPDLSKVRSQVMWLNHVGVRRGTAG